MFDAQSGDRLSTVRCDSAVSSVAYSPDGTKLAAGLYAPSNSVVVFNTQTNEQICSLKVGGEVHSIDFAPCGNKFAIACNDFNSDSYSVQIFSQEGSTGNFACQSTLSTATLLH